MTERMKDKARRLRRVPVDLLLNGEGNGGEENGRFYHPSLSERTTQEVKNLILSGQIKPGDRLYYQDIARLLAVSNTPIRDAFSRLENEGLIVSVPRKGAFVREYSPKDIREIFQIRGMLEGLAVRLACEKEGNLDCTSLRDANNRFRQALERKDASLCAQEDYAFHSTIIEMSGNSKLVELMAKSNFHLLSIAQNSPNFFEIADKYIDMHDKIVTAMESRDSEIAEHLIREHIKYGEEQVLLYMDSARGSITQ